MLHSCLLKQRALTNHLPTGGVPTLIQNPSTYSTGALGTSLVYTLPATPVNGHPILIGVCGSLAPTLSISDNGATSGAWVLVKAFNASTEQLKVYKKIAGGDETTITITASASAYMSVKYYETTGSGNIENINANYVSSASSPVSFGPLVAPTQPNAIPLMFFGWRKTNAAAGGGGDSVTSPWLLSPPPIVVNDAISSAYQLNPPGSGVSGTISYTDTVRNGNAFTWIGFFLDP